MNLKIESCLVENISIRTESGDVIKLILEDNGEHRGRATVVLYDQAGSYFWSAMGKPFKEFFIEAPTSYLIGKLFGTNPQIADDEGNEVLKFIYSNYRAELKELLLVEDKNERINNHNLLRYCFDYIKNNDVSMDMFVHNEKLSEFLSTLIGDDWFHYSIFPEKENHIYQYQKNCIELIKRALQQQLQQELQPA